VQAGPILPGWDGVSVAAELATTLKRRFGVMPPRHHARRFVWVENDASAGALGVHTELARARASGRRPEDLLYVRIATGIGAGIVNKGHLVTGAHGFAGELGHISVDPAGTLCRGCGGRGCLETVASNRAVLSQLRAVFSGADQAAPPAGDSQSADALIERDLARLLERDHPAVDRALADAGWQVGAALGTVCSVLNPEWIVLSGLMPEHRSSRAGKPRAPFVEAVKAALRRSALAQPHQRLDTRTWLEIKSKHQRLTPELLGALGLVVDHLGDAYLLRPIQRWIATPQAREAPLSFAARCDEDPGDD
jgi:predicted NBD/HSP70 family sugar kinase